MPQPGNILIEHLETARIKICDFGLSKLTKDTRNRSHTIVEGTAGTPLYAAPELQSANHTYKVDVFSFGIM